MHLLFHFPVHPLPQSSFYSLIPLKYISSTTNASRAGNSRACLLGAQGKLGKEVIGNAHSLVYSLS
jgi:hypothetical protein